MAIRTSLFNRRRVGLILALVMLAGALPFAGLTSAAGKSSTAPITFTSTLAEVVDPGTNWVDEGGYHFRDMKRHDAVSGELSGTSDVTMNGDFVAGEACDAPDCGGDFSLGDLDLWGTITVNDEAGWWTGQIGRATSADGESVAKIMMIGHGGNAGKAIYGDYERQDGDDGATATTITGKVVTIAGPKRGVSIYFDGCIIPPAATGGGMIMRLGDHDDSGSFYATYPINQPGGTSFGDVTITTEDGEVSAYLMLQSQAEHRMGFFVLTGGTGEHEGLLGFGKLRTSRYASAHCENGAGVGGYWIGEASY